MRPHFDSNSTDAVKANMSANVNTVSVEEVVAVLRDAAACHMTPGGLLVFTNCLYPSNSVVKIAVIGDEPYLVSDRGRALDVLRTHCVEVRSPVRALSNYAEIYGAEVSNSGEITIRDVELAFLPAAISLVANASKDAATLTLEKHRPSPFHEFREQLRSTLRREFSERLTENFRYVGASNKPHTFDHAISTTYNKRLLLSAASDDGNAINSVVVANLDVKLKKDINIIQRIIFDDRVTWRSESLSLLEEGAPIIGFSNLIPHLGQLVGVRA